MHCTSTSKHLILDNEKISFVSFLKQSVSMVLAGQIEQHLGEEEEEEEEEEKKKEDEKI